MTSAKSLLYILKARSQTFNVLLEQHEIVTVFYHCKKKKKNYKKQDMFHDCSLFKYETNL